MAVFALGVLGTQLPTPGFGGVAFDRTVDTRTESRSNLTTTDDCVLWVARNTRSERTAAAESRVVHVSAQGGNATVRGDAPSGSEGRDRPYLLYRGAEQLVYLIDPVRKVYAEFAPAKLVQEIAGATPQSKTTTLLTGGVKMETQVAGLTVTVEPLPDDLVGGEPYRHLRLRIAYTTRMRVMKMSGWTSLDSRDTVEIWLRPGVQGFEEVPAALGLELYRTMQNEVNAAVSARLREVAKDGFPVKWRVCAQTSAAGAGGNSSSAGESSSELSRVREVEFAPAEFELPATFAKTSQVELLKTAGALP